MRLGPPLDESYDGDLCGAKKSSASPLRCWSHKSMHGIKLHRSFYRQTRSKL